MNSIKLMRTVYILAVIVCTLVGITNFTQGKASNGVLWMIASLCWVSCIFNANKSNYPKK